MITIKDISKNYGNTVILRRVQLSIPVGSCRSLLGESGSGKSTLLKILAGLEKPDSGSFIYQGEELINKPAEKRSVVYLSQDPLLFPHMTVYDNLAYGLRVRKMPSSTLEEKVITLAQQIGLKEHLKKHPHQLSGGQRQRVNFGRSVIITPRMLLLDEPFASLDATTRGKMQELYLDISRKYQITSLFVTHDVREALIMGDTYGILRNGSLSCYDTRALFIQQPDSGVAEEINFWKSIQ